MMGGDIDWTALPVLSELLGIVKIEQFISDLVEIRNFKRDNDG